jgi:hypothetical protein
MNAAVNLLDFFSDILTFLDPLESVIYGNSGKE